MNESIKVLLNRRSCRKFIKDKIPSKEDLETILCAGSYAANGMGKQSAKIIAVTNQQVRDALSCANASIMGQSQDFDPFYGAPVILIVIADKSVPTYIYDGSLVMGNMMTAAESLGLGSVWVHRAKEEFEADIGKKILKELGIEGDYEGIGHLAIGYRDGEPGKAAERKNNIFWCC